MESDLGRSLVKTRDYLLERSFLLLRRFKPVRERVTLGEFNDHVEREHVARYRFARRFCTGKRVADIACGTGYGSKILAEVALSVDRYDKELLCGNRQVDLEQQSWDAEYEVIVSFETIEHLANPEFFLANAQETAKLLIVSTPVGEFRGYNPHHKQVWTLDQFRAILGRYFSCQYYYQQGENIRSHPTGAARFVIAIGGPKPMGGEA